MVDTVRFTTASDTLSDLAAKSPPCARTQIATTRAAGACSRIDELGYLSYDDRYADLLFEVVTRHYAGTRFHRAEHREAVRPQRAKFRQGELFDKSYDEIFTGDLTAAQVVLAVMLFRIAENKRKRPPANAPELVRYASNFIAMLMGRYLLSELRLTLDNSTTAVSRQSANASRRTATPTSNAQSTS